MESSADESAEGAPDDTSGAIHDGRGKLTAEAAVSIRGAIDMLDQGDVDGARRVLAGLIDADDSEREELA